MRDPGGYIRETHRPSQVIHSGNDVTSQIRRNPGFDRRWQENRRFFQEGRDRWPGRWRPRSEWGRFGYCERLWFETEVSVSFFAFYEYCPTDYIFLVGNGQFWVPGQGWVYVDFLPEQYFEPITVAIEEVVPVVDDNGDIVAYEQNTYYYNAIWDQFAQAYGYFDYQGQFHWLSLPWLQSW